MLVIAGVVSMVALAGCTPAPSEPLPIPTSATASTPSATPTPAYTPGVDPDADVAAAIAAYEAYVEASNNLVVSDRDTWDPVLDLLLDDYRASSLAIYEEMAANGESFQGEAVILSTEANGVQASILRLHVCTDFSQVLVLNRDGAVIAKPPGDGIRSMNVVLEPVEGSDSLWHIGFFGESTVPCS